MKKIFYCLLTVILITGCVFGFSACNKKKVVDADLSKSVSYAETYKYAGLNDDFRVSLTAGQKEKLFIADGVATDVVNFATLSVTPLKSNLLDKTYSYRVLYEGGEVAGEMTRDVVTHNFTAEVDLGDNLSKVTAVVVIYDETSVEIPVVNMLDGKITYEKALEIAAKEFADCIKENTVDGVLNREICVKLIRDKRNPDSPYYWYVSFIAADNNYWAILINPDDGSVLTKKQ